MLNDSHIELHGIGNAVSGSHDVTLQRLDTLIKNNGRMVHYSQDAFKNVGAWVGVPVVYAETDGASLRHPTHEEVNSGNLPEGYSFAGRVSASNLNASGEPALKGKIEIDDPSLDDIVSKGEMSLSTGFGATIENSTGRDSITGVVAPNHVLMFRRGACPNCFPNDNSARFENIQEYEMDEESKGLLKKISEYFENLKPAEHVQEEIETMVDNTEEIKNLTDENATLKAKLEEMENAAKLEKAEAAWTEMKNILPEGWLGAKEAETRKEFEANPAAFAVKATKFNAENASAAKGAEGSETSTTPIDAENLAQAEVEKFESDYGIKFF